MDTSYEPATLYRDRASERRNLKEEYREAELQYQLLKDKSGLDSYDLGGEIDRTHLVKGLDYNLLNRIRNDHAKPTNSIKYIGLESGSTELGGLVLKTFFSPHPHHSQFDQHLSNLYASICKGLVFNKTSKNIFRRNKIYVFDSNNITNHTCGDPWISGINPYPENSILEELNEALNWHQENRKKPIHERLPTEARIKSNNNNTHDEDNDIFPNADEYNPDGIQTENITDIGLLDNIYEFKSDEKECDVHTYKPRTSNKRKIQEETDVYMECFPEFYGMEMDEEGGTKKKGKKTGSKKEWLEIKNILDDKGTIALDDFEKFTNK